ncbi:YceI family protein [Desulfoluna spongiiphila]|uniref:YceI family protein n=1 Tax=Desulfoluna spongiiphila TaxID=419481 RepID=UPI0012571C1A|nr:YceI family protein [Desulfoluna spongiiphila]VVS93678.1 lipid/polyisoprenoid-binding ycei-like [Desulfoluna spongiiphila]
MKTRHLAIPILLLFITAAAQAAPATWKLDTAHSGIYFDSRHIFSTVRGHFEDFSATLTIDPEAMENSQCRFTVKTKSITTFNRKRDTHLRSAELFDAGKHPTMTFESTRVTPKGGNRYLIEGDLTIRGITKKISAPLIFHGVKPNPFKPSQQVAGFTTQFTVNRLDFKVGDGTFFNMGVMDKEVDITISIEALK